MIASTNRIGSIRIVPSRLPIVEQEVRQHKQRMPVDTLSAIDVTLCTVRILTKNSSLIILFPPLSPASVAIVPS